MRYVARIIAVCVLGAAAAIARPPPSHSKGEQNHDGQCKEFVVPVPVKATAFDFGLPDLPDRYAVTQWAIEYDTWSTTPPSKAIKGNITVDENFDINVKLCVPKDGMKKEIIHLATHGLVFDGRYW